MFLLNSCSSSINFTHKSLYWKNSYKVKVITYPSHKLYLSSDKGVVFDAGIANFLNESVLILKSIGRESIYNRDSMIIGERDIIKRDSLIIRKKKVYSINNYNDKTGSYSMR